MVVDLSSRRALQTISEADVVLEIVDARAPNRTRCPPTEKKAEKSGKRVIIGINKADLVDRGWLEQKKKEMIEETGYRVVYYSAKTREGTRALRTAIGIETKKAGKTDRARVCVVGVPNTGKSTTINTLVGRRVAGTSPRPGYTRGQQWVRLSRRILLLDTPGVLAPSDPSFGIILDPRRETIEKAKALLSLLSNTKNNLSEVYGIEWRDDFLEGLARQKKMVLKGGEPDLERAAKRIIDDWHSGRLTAQIE